MAIKYQEEEIDGKSSAEVIIDNGDLEAVKTVMGQYGFVDQQALFRYALFALLSSSDNKLYIRKDGNLVSVRVADELVKKEDREEVVNG